MKDILKDKCRLCVCVTCFFSSFFRCKAYNTVQLVMFMAEIFDTYMKKRLSDAALGRRRAKNTNMGTLSLDAVIPLGDDKYQVKSQSTASHYTVDLQAGFCECTVGENGSLCKHQVACAEYSMTVLPQVFTATSENRRWLASVAVGDANTPPESFFRGLVEPTGQHCSTGSVSDQVEPQVITEEDKEDQLMVNINEDSASAASEKDQQMSQCPDIAQFVEAVKNVTEKFGNNETVAALSTAAKRLKQVKNSNMLNSILYNIGSAVSVSGAGRGKIRCQPTSIARRGPGKPRGAAPLGKGRRPGCLTASNSKPKRPRNLSKNIYENVANAKSHGSGH